MTDKAQRFAGHHKLFFPHFFFSVGGKGELPPVNAVAKRQRLVMFCAPEKLGIVSICSEGVAANSIPILLFRFM